MIPTLRPVGRLLPAVLIAIAGCDARNSATKSPPTTPETASGVPLRNWVVRPPDQARTADDTMLRLVCAAPNVTEICCALGLRENIVGRTRYCTYPPSIRGVAVIGALHETNIEVLLGLAPDLVLVSGTSRAITDRLARLDLRFVSVPDQSLNDLHAAIAQIALVAGRPRVGEALSRGIREQLDQVSRRYADIPPARVLVLLAPLSDPPAPPFAAGHRSYHGDLLERAGHINVGAQGPAAYGPLSLEAIVRAKPEVVIELVPGTAQRPRGQAGALQTWRKLGPIPAVAHERVHILRGKEHLIPGPRVAATFAALCRLIAEGSHDAP